MAILVDACSLVMIAKNYLPLDKSGELMAFLQKSFCNKELILLDAIYDEIKYVSNGIALKKMPFLCEKGLVVNTEELLPFKPQRFDRMIDNNFCIRALRNGMTNEEYAQQKADFIKSGDAKIIIFCLNREKAQLGLDEVIVMTEETSTPNDGKLFAKLPTICAQIGVRFISVVEYLKINGFKIEK